MLASAPHCVLSTSLRRLMRPSTRLLQRKTADAQGAAAAAAASPLAQAGGPGRAKPRPRPSAGRPVSSTARTLVARKAPHFRNIADRTLTSSAAAAFDPGRVLVPTTPPPPRSGEESSLSDDSVDDVVLVDRLSPATRVSSPGRDDDEDSTLWVQLH